MSRQKKSTATAACPMGRREMIRLTGGALIGTVVGCSGEPPPTTSGVTTAEAGPPIDAGLPSPDLGVDQRTTDDLAPDATVIEPGPIFVLHLSDIHIGSGSLAVPAFDHALSTILPAFSAHLVVATGDLVESGNHLEDWGTYREMVDRAGLTADHFVEIPGNHDSMLDGALVNYASHTLAGRSGHGTHGLYHLDSEGRRVRIVALNTASAGNPIQDPAGYLKEEQVDQLIGEIDADPRPVHATIVLGHHPPTAAGGLGLLGTDKHLRKLLQHTAAAVYLHGHLHMFAVNWEGPTLMAQARSLGNPSDWIPGGSVAGFNLFALDEGPVVKAFRLLGDATNPHVEWPAVLITKPARASLGDGNPWATPLPRAASRQTLRAGVFAPQPVAGVRFRVGNAAWQPMSAIAGRYEASFDTPDTNSCEIEVQARLADGSIGSDTIGVELA